MRTTDYEKLTDLLSKLEGDYELESLRRERQYLIVDREKAAAKIRELDAQIAAMGREGEDELLELAGWTRDDTVKGEHVWEHEDLAESPVTREWALKATKAALMFASKESKPYAYTDPSKDYVPSKAEAMEKGEEVEA